MKDIIAYDIGGGDELYDLSNDPNEQQNLIGKGLKIEEELRQEVVSFREKMRAARQNNKDIEPLPSNIQIQSYP